MRTTATPAGPALPVARAKIVSSEDDAEVPGRESCWTLFMLEPTARRNVAGGGAPLAGCRSISVAEELLNAVARRGCLLLLLLLLLLLRCPVEHIAPPTAVETVRHESRDGTTRDGVLRSHGKPGRCLGRAINELRRRHTDAGLEGGSRCIALEVNAVAVAAVVLAVMLGTKQCDPSGDSNVSRSETGSNGESPPTSISVLRTASHEAALGHQIAR